MDRPFRKPRPPRAGRSVRAASNTGTMPSMATAMPACVAVSATKVATTDPARTAEALTSAASHVLPACCGRGLSARLAQAVQALQYHYQIIRVDRFAQEGGGSL